MVAAQIIDSCLPPPHGYSGMLAETLLRPDASGEPPHADDLDQPRHRQADSNL